MPSQPPPRPRESPPPSGGPERISEDYQQYSSLSSSPETSIGPNYRYINLQAPVPTKEDQIQLSEIADCPHAHCDDTLVDLLVTSIGKVGLLNPPALDNLNRIVFGRLRLAALRKLRMKNPERFENLFPDGLIPVRRMDFDSKKYPIMALAIESNEMFVRRRNSPSTIARMAERLARLFRIRRGRPSGYHPPPASAIGEIFGISISKLSRALKSHKSEEKT